MNWTTAVDFDIAAVYESKEGQRGLIYFGDLGTENSFPYISLNKDSGIINTDRKKTEDLVINQFNDMASMWLFCWDYQSVEIGKTGNLKNSDVRLLLEKQSGHELNFEIAEKMPNNGNICYFAKVMNTDKGIDIQEMAVDGLLKGLKSIEQLMALVRYQETYLV